MATKKNTKSILKYAIPILLTYFLQQIYSFCDMSICGHYLSSFEVSGIGNTSNITMLLTSFAFGCTSGFGSYLTYVIGTKKIDKIKNTLCNQFYLSAVISILMTFISIIFLKPMMSLINVSENINPIVYKATYEYSFIMFLGCVFQFFYNLSSYFLRNLGDNKTPIYILIFSIILNIILDILLVKVITFGVKGAAIATVISEFISVIISYFVIFSKYKEYRLNRQDFKISRSIILKNLELGIILGLQSSVLSIGLIFMQGRINQFDISKDGNQYSANANLGYCTACKLHQLLMIPFQALGASMLFFTGANYGKNNIKDIKNGLFISILIMLLLYIVVILSIGLPIILTKCFYKFLLSEEKINDSLIKYGNNFILVLLPFYMILGLLFILKNFLIGIQKSIYVLIGGILEFFSRIFISYFIPPLINKGPINSEATIGAFRSLAIADPISWILAVLSMLVGVLIFFCKNKKGNSNE